MTGKRKRSSPDERQRKDLTLEELLILEQSKRNPKLAEKKPITLASQTSVPAARNDEKNKKQESLSHREARLAAASGNKGKNIIKETRPSLTHREARLAAASGNKGKNIIKETRPKRSSAPFGPLPDVDNPTRKEWNGYIAYLKQQKKYGRLTKGEATYFDYDRPLSDDDYEDED